MVLFACCWAIALAIGIGYLVRYKNTPGPAATSIQHWPAEAPPLASDGYTLALFLHPQCPCSRATVASLARLLPQAGPSLHVYAFAVLPPGTSADWSDTSLIASARAIPGVEVIIDTDARLARRFGALTSGQTALYDPHGNVRFSGGITDGRGHEGDNPGSQAIKHLLLHPTDKVMETPVFGCALLNPVTP
jgi:hypothetical protein